MTVGAAPHLPAGILSPYRDGERQAGIDGFANQPAVLNGASDLLDKLFGDAAPHARTAIGVNALPSNVSVELEMIVAAR